MLFIVASIRGRGCRGAANPNPNFPEPELGFLAELEPELFHELSFFEVSNQYFFMQSFSDERVIIVG